jgi:urease accessory protein
VPAQLEPHRILIRDDAVIVNMLHGLGATVTPVMAAFTPETGAYDSSGTAAAQLEHSAQHVHAPQHEHPAQHEHSRPGHHHDG